MKDKEAEKKACLLLLEFYENIDEVFLGYFVSLKALETYRSKLDQEYKHLWTAELGLNNEDAERRVEEADHMLGDGEFRIYATTSKMRKILSPGVFEDLQAKNAIKIIYDSWEICRSRTQNLLGRKIQGDIWGDLRYLRNSIVHKNSRGDDGIKKAKLITDFVPGQKITLTHEIMAKIQHEIENWYTEFQLYHRTDLNSESIICRMLPSGKVRTFGLFDLQHAIRVFGIKRSKKNSVSPSQRNTHE